jgi:hypothetical protein
VLSEPTWSSGIGAGNIGREADAEHFEGPVDSYAGLADDDRRTKTKLSRSDYAGQRLFDPGGVINPARRLLSVFVGLACHVYPGRAAR